MRSEQNGGRRLTGQAQKYHAHSSCVSSLCLSPQRTILIGHSSGAVAGMRFLETHRLRGLLLVSACHTDLGMASETISGYYSRPWQWETIRKNAEWIVQLHSLDDPFIPIEEARHVAENLQSEVRRRRQKSAA